MAETKKTDSRKFVVWLVWLIITILVIAWCALVMIITKQIQDQLIGLIEKSLAYFFAVSMMNALLCLSDNSPFLEEK